MSIEHYFHLHRPRPAVIDCDFSRPDPIAGANPGPKFKRITFLVNEWERQKR